MPSGFGVMGAWFPRERFDPRQSIWDLNVRCLVSEKVCLRRLNCIADHPQVPDQPSSPDALQVAIAHGTDERDCAQVRP
jgi:hypothetical protein